MKYIRIVLAISALLIASCTNHPRMMDGYSKDNGLNIDTMALNEGVLRISLPSEVPRNLAIQAPSGDWFVVQESAESIEIMPQKEFESSREFNLKLDELYGTTWRNSKKFRELIFKSTGTYLIYFANNLETEPENTFSLKKRIQYKNKN